MKKLNIQELTTYSMVAAIYVLLTWAFSFMAFGKVQFRVAEVLVLLCFFQKKYFIPLTLGCFIANLMSSLGPIDMLFGTVATIISLLLIMHSKSIYLAAFWPIIINGFLISIELAIVGSTWYLEALVINFLSIAFGELICVGILGVSLFQILRKNQGFMHIICANHNYDSIEN